MKYNKLVVVDIEATCWADNARRDESEIIEVGIAELWLREMTIERASYPVKPDNFDISPFCTQLTGWTAEALQDAKPLAEVARLIAEKHNLRNKVWASWGNYDRTQFRKECGSKGIQYPFSQDHINLKTQFALRRHLKKGVGIKGALRMLGLTFEGRLHNGGDDAYNAARVGALLYSPRAQDALVSVHGAE